jgi:hypothetical protein
VDNLRGNTQLLGRVPGLDNGEDSPFKDDASSRHPRERSYETRVTPTGEIVAIPNCLQNATREQGHQLLKVRNIHAKTPGLRCTGQKKEQKRFLNQNCVRSTAQLGSNHSILLETRFRPTCLDNATQVDSPQASERPALLFNSRKTSDITKPCIRITC